MFTIRGTPRRLGNGVSRRDFLRVGSLGALGLSWPLLLGAGQPAAGSSFGRAKRCVLLFLTGGPPQHDTWDPKPDAPAEVRGELKPVATTVPGVRVSELFPHLARQAHRFSILRSVTHGDTVHHSAGYTMLTGVYHPLANSANVANVRPTPNDHPHVGSLVALARPPRDGVPAFAALPEVVKDDAINEFPGQDAGFLGPRYGPLLVEADTAAGRFRPSPLALADDLTADRLQDRRSLLTRLDQAFAPADRRPTVSGLDQYREQAWALLRAPAVRQALELDREPTRRRDAYGPHLFGKGCLLARRLLEAGVALVTVYWHYEGPKSSPVWDTHDTHYPHLRTRLAPPTDQAVAALLDDLAVRGLLDETLVVVLGEFGRTPKINAQAGRDHWPQVQSILLAGGGLRGGAVYGASDRLGALPADLPVTPPDLIATILHLLGVRPDLEVRDRIGRPVRVCDGTPVRALVG